jgi:methylated-DNA-[protein]-cysteine S-methyltransferase
MNPLYLQVYQFLQTIPKGKVVTYKTIADRFSIHPRYVGRILHINQDHETYPCYKVIKSDGGVSGYALGCEDKIRRLVHDGIEITDGKIDQKYFWKA